eukprot:12868829-Ditylum_brightwellii.AAC.1
MFGLGTIWSGLGLGLDSTPIQVSPGLDSTPIQDLLNNFSIKLWVTAGNFPSSVESQKAIIHQA